MTAALIIFDCDGVLVDSEPITNRVLAEDLTAHGLPTTTEQCMDLFVGGTMAGVFQRALEMGAALPEDWLERIYAKTFDALSTQVEAVPGIHFVLDQLDKAKVPYCVGSNGPMRKMEITLSRTALWDRVAGRIHSAHDVGIAKPDPGLFLHAARAHRADPAQTVVIEDSASGAKAAKAAGMRCFGYTAGGMGERMRAEGAVLFEDMIALPGLLGLDGKEIPE